MFGYDIRLSDGTKIENVFEICSKYDSEKDMLHTLIRSYSNDVECNYNIKSVPGSIITIEGGL